jgi:hypothetical protein
VTRLIDQVDGLRALLRGSQVNRELIDRFEGVRGGKLAERNRRYAQARSENDEEEKTSSRDHRASRLLKMCEK